MARNKIKKARDPSYPARIVFILVMAAFFLGTLLQGALYEQNKVLPLVAQLKAMNETYAYCNSSDYADLPCTMTVKNGVASELRCNPSAKALLDLNSCEDELSVLTRDTGALCQRNGWVPRPVGFNTTTNVTYAGNCIFCAHGFCAAIPNCTSSTPVSMVIGNETYNYTAYISTGSDPSEYRIGKDSG